MNILYDTPYVVTDLFSKVQYNIINKYFAERYARYFLLRTKLRWMIQKIRYNNPANPFQIIKIRPAKCTHRLKPNSSVLKYNGLGQIKGGQWHKKGTEVLENDAKYKGIIQRYNHGYEWSETSYAKKRYKKGNDIETFLKERGNKTDQLYKSIKNNGYIPNYKRNGVNHSGNYVQSLEPIVAIGPNGEIYLREGKHRFAIAAALNIEIPVYVLARHKGWQKKREELSEVLRSRENESEFFTHPDMQDIVNDDAHLETL